MTRTRGARERGVGEGGGGGHNGMCSPGRSTNATSGGEAGKNEPRHALDISYLDLLYRVRYESHIHRKTTLTMGNRKTAEEGQRREAQATAAL